MAFNFVFTDLAVTVDFDVVVINKEFGLSELFNDRHILHVATHVPRLFKF
jgi:hypothetical protein